MTVPSAGVLKFGDLAAQQVSMRVGAMQASVAALKALGGKNMADGQIFAVQADQSLWQYSAASAATGDDILVSNPNSSGSGRLLRMPGLNRLTIPFTFATADAAILLTLPAGCYIKPSDMFWGIGTTFSGGASSAIGVSSSTVSGHTTKGDFLGGATGDVAATLVSTAVYAMGTVGAQMGTVASKRLLMKPTDTLRFDRITSAFTAGVGTVNVICEIMQNLGA